jgi:hypothetical protein
MISQSVGSSKKVSRTPTNAALRTSTIYIYIYMYLKKTKKKHNPDVKDVARKNVENTVRPGQTKFPTHLQVPSKQKSNRLQPYLQATPGAEDCTLSIPAIKCARGSLHPGSNPPTLKDMHVAVFFLHVKPAQSYSSNPTGTS